MAKTGWRFLNPSLAGWTFLSDHVATGRNAHRTQDTSLDTVQFDSLTTAVEVCSAKVTAFGSAVFNLR